MVDLWTITGNVAGSVEFRQLNGREHLVVPVVMIREGVLPGSSGKILYTRDSVNQHIHRWNGIPLVLGHPEDSDGNKISARSPEIIEKVGLGYVFNTEFKDDLRAKAWFDADVLRMKERTLYDRILQGKPTELSTGLFTHTVHRSGYHNGTEYDQVLSSYQPDHLAILMHEAGACSLSDGCGVLVGNCGCDKKCTKCASKSTTNEKTDPVKDLLDEVTKNSNKKITSNSTKHIDLKFQSKSIYPFQSQR